VNAFLIPFIKTQSAQGYEVAVACNSTEDTSLIQKAGIKVHTYPLEESLNVKNIYLAIKDLRRIIESKKFELVIIHMPLAGGVGRIAAKLSANKPKIIYVAHGLPCAPKQNRARWLFWFVAEWFLGRITDAMLVMNTYDYELARRVRLIRRPKHIYRIPGMGVDIDKFRPDTNTNHDSFWRQFGIEGRKTIVCVARLVKEKGILDFLEAARILSARDYAFFLIGAGPLANKVKRFIKDNHLHNKVFPLGQRYDVVQFVKRCDVFVLPTYYPEGLPVSILEAMACAKPVIATNHRGCKEEVVDCVTGYLVNTRNPEQLAMKIDGLLEDETLRVEMGKAGRERVERFFSLDNALRMFCETVDAIVNS